MAGGRGMNLVPGGCRSLLMADTRNPSCHPPENLHLVAVAAVFIHVYVYEVAASSSGF